jgi:hypothetical protein
MRKCVECSEPINPNSLSFEQKLIEDRLVRQVLGPDYD